MAAKVEIKSLIEHCVHFGHRTCFWEPKMAPYIYGKKSKDLHIINLLKTRPLFQKALEEVESVAANNGKILFVSTKRVAQEAIESAAKKCEMPYVSKRWPGGMLTNFKTILRSVKKMKHLEGFIDTPEYDAMKKKERLSLQRDLGKLQASFNGIRDMTSLPDMLFIIDVGHEHIAVKEAKKLGIPVVGIVDTNCSPDDIDYIIPGNDDSQKAIDLYTRLMSETIDAARVKIKEKLKAAEVKLEGKTKVKVVKKAAGQPAPEVDSEKEAPKKVATSKTEKPSEKESAEKSAPTKKIIRVGAKKVAEDEVKKAAPAKKAAATKKATATKKVATKKADSEAGGQAATAAKKTSSKEKIEKS
jgi:small subunit ribosomal protein S2